MPGNRNKSDLNFLKAIVDGLPFAVFCKDYASGIGQFILWNQRAENLWGFKYDDVFKKTDFDLFPNDQAEGFRQKDLETLHSGSVTYTSEELVSKDGRSEKWFRTWKVPLLDDDGNPRYLVGVSQDISEMSLKLRGKTWF